MTSAGPSRQEPGPLLTLRALVLIVVALIAAGAAAGLTWWQFHSVPNALLLGGATFAAGLRYLDDLVG